MKKQENSKKASAPENQEDGKIHVTDSVFKTAKEMQLQRMAEMEEQQRKLQQQAELREKKKREEYDRRILEEKKELLRMKQNPEQESTLIHEETPEPIKLTPWKKFTNFIYHSKWWLGMGIFVAACAVFLIHNLVTKERPDLVVLVLAENDYVGNSEELEHYIESFTEDFNDNGEVLVSAYYIPYSDNAQQNYATGVDTKLTAELQSAESMIVIGGEKITKILDPEAAFVNLEEIYPDNPHIDKTFFYLKDTDFAEKIGITESAAGDDLFISFRKPQHLLYTDEEEMQKMYDRDFPVFDKLINDLSE